MKSPVTGKEMTIQKEWRTMQFRKEEFKVLFHTYKCEESGEQFEDEQFAGLNYNQLVNQYREKYAIPFPEQVKETRDKYGLSAVKMSEILGFGVNTYRQYEAGEVPSQSNARLIQIAVDPVKFRDLVETNPALKGKALEELLKRIEKLEDENKSKIQELQIEQYFFGTTTPDSTTGFRLPSITRLNEMIIYFAEKTEPWKTKLNKLLFYADFLMFKQYGCSISGARYVAIDLGPVPDNFQGIYEYLAKKEEFNISLATFTNGSIGEQFKPKTNRSFNPKLFTKEELETMAIVAKKFKNTGAKEIIEISHREKAWLENKDTKSIIDYKYGFDLINV